MFLHFRDSNNVHVFPRASLCVQYDTTQILTHTELMRSNIDRRAPSIMRSEALSLNRRRFVANRFISFLVWCALILPWYYCMNAVTYCMYQFADAVQWAGCGKRLSHICPHIQFAEGAPARSLNRQRHGREGLLALWFISMCIHIVRIANRRVCVRVHVARCKFYGAISIIWYDVMSRNCAQMQFGTHTHTIFVAGRDVYTVRSRILLQ